MLTFLSNLKPGDEFLCLQDDTVYKIVSEPIDDGYLCADDDGFGQIFHKNTIVRPVK